MNKQNSITAANIPTKPLIRYQGQPPKKENIYFRDGKALENSTDANFRPKKQHKKLVIHDILFAPKQRIFP